jgi:hypothetical protein
MLEIMAAVRHVPTILWFSRNPIQRFPKVYFGGRQLRRFEASVYAVFPLWR